MQNRRGFTAIEAIVSIVILSIVGLMIGQTFLQTGRSAVKSKESRQAAALSEMVLEQYSAYAAHDYSNLATYDQTKAMPKTFFSTKDNLGYDNMRISTHAELQDKGGALVTVKIYWGGATEAESLTFTKSFAESGGARHAQEYSGI